MDLKQLREVIDGRGNELVLAIEYPDDQNGPTFSKVTLNIGGARVVPASDNFDGSGRDILLINAF